MGVELNLTKRIQIRTKLLLRDNLHYASGQYAFPFQMYGIRHQTVVIPVRNAGKGIDNRAAPRRLIPDKQDCFFRHRLSGQKNRIFQLHLPLNQNSGSHHQHNQNHTGNSDPDISFHTLSPRTFLSLYHISFQRRQKESRYRETCVPISTLHIALLVHQ